MARKTTKAARSRTAKPAVDDSTTTGETPTICRGWVPLIMLLLVAVVTAAYWALPTHSYVNYDDNLHVYENIRLNPTSPANVLHFWTNPFIHRGEDGLKPYEQLYAPITFTFYAWLAGFARLPKPVDVPGMGTWSLDPHVYHTAGLILHVLNTLLVFLLVRRIVRNDWASAAGAAFFGLHPLQVEPVVWVSAMNNELVDLFGFLALLFYLQNTETGQRLHYGLAIACLVLALLSKPSAVVLVVMAGILDTMVIGRPIATAARSLWPWAVLSLACVLLNQGLQPHTVISDPLITVPVWFRPIIAGDLLAFYLGKLVWPQKLGFDYGLYPRRVFQSGIIPYLYCLVPVGLALLLRRVSRRSPMLAVAGLLFLVALLPVIGLVPYYFQATSTVADRYLYLALFGPALALSWLLSRVRPRYVFLAAGFCVALLALLGVRTVDQVRYWRDSEALYRRAIQVNPMSFTAYDNFGIMLAQQCRYAEAIEMLGRAHDIDPNDPGPPSDLSKALFNDGMKRGPTGDLTGAVTRFTEAIQVKPDFLEAYDNLGVAYSQLGQWNEAAQTYRALLRVKPDYPVGHFELGAVLLQLGQRDDARAEFQEALRLRPDYPQAASALAAVHN